MTYGGGPYAGAPYGGLAGGAVKVTASDSFTMADSATGLVAKVALDSWAISDAADRATTAQRSAADSFTVGDALTSTVGRARQTNDSWAVSDSPSATLGNWRLTSDGWTISDFAKRTQAQLVDLPERLALALDHHFLVLASGTTLVLRPSVPNLRLKLERRGDTIRSESRSLVLKDEPRRLGIDG